ncbi:MAG: hypothetical protein PHE73_08550 [Sulfurovaceae bacterium]|nr:hypothetical protein [Sulfurovaceae bacterium]
MVYYNIASAAGVYILVALIVSLSWIIFWGNDPKTKLLSFIATQAILILPPIGLISWVNPIQAAALFFPGTKIFGFFLLTALLFFMYLKPKFAPVLILFFLLPIYSVNLVKQDKKINALFGNENYETGTVAPIVDYQRQIKYLRQIENTSNEFFLLPENALGYVTGANGLVWQNTNKTIFAGASYLDTNITYNTLSLVKNGSINPVYVERVPVPLSMWKPFSKTGVHANIFGKGGFVLNNKKYGVLVCYEQLIMWTWLQTMLHDPDTILAVSNLWWAKDTSILSIQKENIELWSILFDKPYTFSYNL